MSYSVKVGLLAKRSERWWEICMWSKRKQSGRETEKRMSTIASLGRSTIKLDYSQVTVRMCGMGVEGGCLDGISWLQQHPSELSQRYLHQLETLSWPLAEWFLNPAHCTSPLHKHKIHNYTPSQQHSSYHT